MLNLSCCSKFVIPSEEGIQDFKDWTPVSTGVTF